MHGESAHRKPKAALLLLLRAGMPLCVHRPRFWQVFCALVHCPIVSFPKSAHLSKLTPPFERFQET